MKSRPERKAGTRERILRSAARLMRQRGISGARVADVMGDAGLTVGGFYAHFPSKEALVDETLRAVLGERRARLRSVSTTDWRTRARVLLEGYLTTEHRDDPANGCPVPAVVGDVAHEGIGRTALADEIAALAHDMVVGTSSSPPAPDAYRAALGALSLMAGGVVLARALRGTPLSDDVLAGARAFGAAALRGTGR